MCVLCINALAAVQKFIIILCNSNSLCNLIECIYYYRVVHGECEGGMQKVHYITPNHCRAPSGMPHGRLVPCSTRLPFLVEVRIHIRTAFYKREGFLKSINIWEIL